nr:LytTR family DNA-binding domain-containing protein [Brevundimonas variabilis]
MADDEPPARELLRFLCEAQDVSVIGEAEDGRIALALLERLKPDFVMLDITMPVMDGMTVARRLFDRPQAPAIVFTTAFSQYAVSAFDVAAVDYLLKPIDPSRFAVAVERVRIGLGVNNGKPIDCLWVPNRSDLLRIEITAIERIEAEKDYVRIHVPGRSYLLRETMDGLQDRLPRPDFLRLHRSTIVRRHLMTGVHHEGSGVWSAIMKDGTLQRIGRSYLNDVRAGIIGPD